MFFALDIFITSSTYTCILRCPVKLRLVLAITKKTKTKTEQMENIKKKLNNIYNNHTRIKRCTNCILALQSDTDQIVFSYDPDTDIWSSIPALPYGVYAHAACEVNGSIYITGGVTDNLSDPVPVSYHCYNKH